jgi:hypothetical protein
MQTYDAVIRLGGSTLNEVTKAGLTAAEIITLQNVHGTDAVVRVKQRKNIKCNHQAERTRLGKIYGEGRVEHLFGASHTKLPSKVDGLDFVKPDPDELTDEQLEELTVPDED